MFLRAKRRFKDGKAHRYWSLVENCRVAGGRAVQRQVLYLGEINDAQRAAWCKSIEAHIFVAFIAYCLQLTLKFQARQLAPGLTPRAILEKFSAIQMVDVHLPTTDGRHLILSRYTQPNRDQQLRLQRLKLTLPQQPPPRIQSSEAASHTVSATAV